MSTIFVLVGPPASGKSTWATEYVTKNRGTAIRLNRDSLRMMLTNTLASLPGGTEVIVSDLVNTGIEMGLEWGFDVIVDQTNCKKKYIDRIVERFSHLADIEFVVFEVSLEELKRRNDQRSITQGITKVPDEMMERMYENFQILKKNYKFEKILKKKE